MKQKIKSFDKNNISEVRKILEKKLQEITDEYGIVFTMDRITYQNDSFRGKLLGNVEGCASPYEKEFLRFYPNSENLIGEIFKYNGISYIFMGFKPNARTKKAIIQNAEGKEYRINFPLIKDLLRKGN